MTAQITTVEAAIPTHVNCSTQELKVLGDSVEVAEPRNLTLSKNDEPQSNTEYEFTITRAIHHKDGSPFLLKGFVGIGGNDVAGSVHVSAIPGNTRTDRDWRFNLLQVGDTIPVELLEKADGYRFSWRLACERQELEELMQDSKLEAIVVDDANEDSESVFVLINKQFKARLHASALKDNTRNARDARIQSFKKGDILDVSINSFARHPKFPVFQISCREFGKQERKPAWSSKPKCVQKKSPLGNKTGDRADADAKRNERRLRDQAQRNKMKTAGGKAK